MRPGYTGLVKPIEGPPLPSLSEKESLSVIIKELNAHYGFEASTDEVITVQYLETKLDASEVLKVSTQVNSKDNFKLSFESVVKEKIPGIARRLQTLQKDHRRPRLCPKPHRRLLDRYLQRLGATARC